MILASEVPTSTVYTQRFNLHKSVWKNRETTLIYNHTNAGNKVKYLYQTAKKALGGKNKIVVYSIPCGCGQYSYAGDPIENGRLAK